MGPLAAPTIKALSASVSPAKPMTQRPENAELTPRREHRSAHLPPTRGKAGMGALTEGALTVFMSER